MGTSPSPIKKIYVDPETGLKPPDGRLKQPGDVQPVQNKTPKSSFVYTDQMEQNLARAKITKNSKRAQLMLEKLGFDPITRLVDQYERIERDIQDYDRLRRDGPDYDSEGKMIRKFSAMAYSALLAIQQKLITELLPYGYAKQAGNDDGDNNREIPRLSIVLTPKGGNAAAMELQTYNDNRGTTYDQP